MSDYNGFESRVKQRCEAMKASGREFSESAIRSQHAAAEARVDRKIADIHQQRRFTTSPKTPKPRGTLTTIIHANGAVEHVNGDISKAEAFGETGISNISRKKDKAGL